MAVTATAAAPAAGRPALESGDRMDREEFERRYTCRPDIKKAELVDGVVYVSSPTRIQEHSDPHGILAAVIGQYRLTHPGVLMSIEGTLRIDRANEYQPDIVLRYTVAAGGTSRVDDDSYLAGVPELCAEVAASSLSYDLGLKKEVYRRLGVREYLVWQTEDGRIDWWELRDGEYVPIEPDAAGVLHSRVFPGLSLKPAELLALAGESAS